MGGLLVIGASLVLAAVIAGVGFASGSITAAQYQYGKVTLCHHTHSKKHPYVTITVAQSAVAAHLRHGDTTGACSPTATTTSHGQGHGHSKQSGSASAATTSTAATASTTASTSGNGHAGNGGGQGNHGKGHK